MNKPEHMKHLINVACFLAIAVNLPFAVYGYLLFGNEVRGYVFENMPGTTFDNIVRLLLSIELSLTFPLVFKPATLVVEEWMKTIITDKVNLQCLIHVLLYQVVIIFICSTEFYLLWQRYTKTSTSLM